MTIEIVPVRGFTDMPKTLYSPVVDGKQLSVVAENEDIAYILGLQFKYDGPDSQFTKRPGSSSATKFRNRSIPVYLPGQGVLPAGVGYL